MADLHLNTESIDPQLTEPESPDSQEEETMPPPFISDLPHCQPSISIQNVQDASEEDQRILLDLQTLCQTSSIQLKDSTQIDSKVQKIRGQAGFCATMDGSEDFWSYFVIWPIFKLARKICKLEQVLVLPLSTTTVSPSSLLPKWKQTPVARRIDFGLAIKLDDRNEERIESLPISPKQEGYGIGPASTNSILRNCPIFCFVEVKKEHQVVDPKVQMAVWASAAYTRWEQVMPGSNDLPITFGWTIEGHHWLLYMIRRLPDGSRRITENFRTYDSRSTLDIYLIIATLSKLMEYGNDNFRGDFQVSVLGNPASTRRKKNPDSTHKEKRVVGRRAK